MVWLPAALNRDRVAGGRVLEVGALDVNGSIRPAIEAMCPAAYVALDQQPGRGVDVLDTAENLVARFGPASFDVVVSAEMLEHAANWQQALIAMVNVLAPGGQLALTTRSPGFPYHPFPVDCWRFTPILMKAVVDALGLTMASVVEDPEAPGVFVTGIRPDAAPVMAWALDGLTAQAVTG
jgi:SAM-dependent methyltransferase